MNKYIILMFATMAVAGSANAQVSENVRKAMADPKTKERAAKADVLLIDKTKLYNEAEQVCKTFKKDKKEKK